MKSVVEKQMGRGPAECQYQNQGDRSLIFLEPKHGCGSPPRCHIHFIDWVGQGTLYSLDLPQTDKNLQAARADPNSFEVCRVAREIQQMLNLGYPWIFGKIVVTLQQNNKRIMEANKYKHLNKNIHEKDDALDLSQQQGVVTQ